MPDTTFEVSPEVTPPRHARAETVDYIEKLRIALRRPIEASWLPTAPLVHCDGLNALASTLRIAFYDHRPLRLSPDAIWITLVRGFALHINRHAEEFRHRFVSHSGREKITITRHDFLPGADNPWPEAFAEFGDRIDERTGGAAAFVRTKFSTTGRIERAVADLMLMETCQTYFEYEMLAGCGIPSVTLTGTAEDWQLLRERARSFADFGLEDWVNALDPILAQFERAKRGEAEPYFWQSMFRYHSGSFGSLMSGWAMILYPYLYGDTDELAKNPHFNDWQQELERYDKSGRFERFPRGKVIGDIPPCFTSVPLTVVWGESETPMRLVGGLLGVVQHEATGAVEPECGWVLLYDEPLAPFTERQQRNYGRYALDDDAT